MTVCIATISYDEKSDRYLIIGAADRMITAGDDVSYEPPMTKIVQITPTSCLMTAGDANIHMEIYYELGKMFIGDPSATIEQIADGYVEIYNKIHRRIANAEVLRLSVLT